MPLTLLFATQTPRYKFSNSHVLLLSVFVPCIAFAMHLEPIHLSTATRHPSARRSHSLLPNLKPVECSWQVTHHLFVCGLPGPFRQSKYTKSILGDIFFFSIGRHEIRFRFYRCSGLRPAKTANANIAPDCSPFLDCVCPLAVWVRVKG